MTKAGLSSPLFLATGRIFIKDGTYFHNNSSAYINMNPTVFHLYLAV
jgi:hypothetical protein